MTTHLSNNHPCRYQTAFEGSEMMPLQHVPVEILEENDGLVKEIRVYKYNLKLFDDVDDEWKTVMKTSVLHSPLLHSSSDAVLQQYSEDQLLHSPEEDQYAVTHHASSPDLESALDDKGQCEGACSSPMWCTKWMPVSEQPEYCDWVQMGCQYSDWCMIEELLFDQEYAQQDDCLCAKDCQTLTTPGSLEQTVPLCLSRDIHPLEEEKLLDSHSTPAKGRQKRPLTTPENPPSKRISALSASPGLLLPPDTTATNLWLDVLLQSSVESLESAIKEVHNWLDSTATETGAQQDGSSRLKGPEGQVLTPTKQDCDAEAGTGGGTCRRGPPWHSEPGWLLSSCP